ncbi:hypothetical protein ACWELO_04760 [Streptomyces sp. NPDC004596]
MRHVKRIATAVALTASAFLVSACSPGTPPDANGSAAGGEPIVNKENWPGRVPSSGLAKGLSLPLEAYMASYQDQVTVERAADDLQRSCMKGYGIDLTLPRAGANPPPSDNDAGMERRYGITDRTETGKYGYQLPPALREHTERTPRDLSGVEVEVLTGRTKPEPPGTAKGVEGGGPVSSPVRDTQPARAEYHGKKLKKGGCVGWAKSRLGVNEADPVFVAQLAGDSLVRSMKDDRVTEAVAAWSSCMDGKGHKGLADPYRAMGRGAADDGSPSRELIALAVDDVDCKKRTDLVRIWFRVESGIQRRQIADNRARLTGVEQRHGRAMAAARKQIAASAR